MLVRNNTPSLLAVYAQNKLLRGNKGVRNGIIIVGESAAAGAATRLGPVCALPEKRVS